LDRIEKFWKQAEPPKANFSLVASVTTAQSSFLPVAGVNTVPKGMAFSLIKIFCKISIGSPLY
jgi:hypothetical protein